MNKCIIRRNFRLRFRFLAVSFLAVFQLLACSRDPDVTPPPVPPPPPPSGLDTLDFNVLVYIDKPSVEGHLGGSQRIVESRMNDLFRKVTNYWNDCSHGKLKYVFRYKLADMVVYEGSSNDAVLRKKIYDDPIDFSKYDVSVLFDCKQDNGETGNGGGAHGGGSDFRSVITIIAGTQPKDIFQDNTYHTLVHELGHYRGVTDLYQYIIAAKDNPVSHEAFEAPVCIMNWAGCGEWSDYSAACINRAGGSKRIGVDFVDFFDSMYPKKFEFNVTVGGQPKRGITVNLYGARAGHRDIWPEVFVTGQTDSNGKLLFVDTKKYFRADKSISPQHVPADLPYGRWFGFLAEIVYGSSKKYVWMSECEVQMLFFKGEDTYRVGVAF